jgi:MHS family proline/betaine transporter-like MFS transporter
MAHIMTTRIQHQQQIPYHLIAACSWGTTLEWYDFSIYAYLAPTLALLFFPQEDHITSIILAYSVFALGFLVRPIGAILFGHFGDRVGRKKILMCSIVLIASSTSLIGFLPTYNQVGTIAPLLLIALRILQGLSVGGEVIGAGSFVMESTQSERSGFATSLIWASSGIGILLSSVVVTMTTLLVTHTEMLRWGWRLPFLLGSVTGLVGYYLRKNTAESSSFKKMQANKTIAKFPLLDAIKKFNSEILMTAGLYILSAIITYLIFVYMPVYASKIIGLPFSQTMAVNTIIMACMIFLVPVFGHYSDRLGRRIILMVSATGLLLFAFPLYSLIAHGNLIDLIIAQSVLAVLAAGYQGSITRAVLDMFPTNVRYSAAAFGYNLSYSLFGGTAPIIAVYLIGILKFNTAPSLYLILGAFVSLIAAFKMRETQLVNSN